MKINIAASHRFHLLDLARELETQGHEVRFYSYVPTKRAVKFGLKSECSYSLFWVMFPILFLVKCFKSNEYLIRVLDICMDAYLALFMKPCDVYIALGTVYENSLTAAKKRFNATTILEWGSKHNDEQQRILETVPNYKKQSVFFKNRALRGYQLADYIAIPSNHVRDSFTANGVAESKLIQHPYGVDLSQFHATALSAERCFDVILVGGWSYVKGCDLLIDFFKTSTLTFLHVGAIGDLEFPANIKNMTHYDSVDQKQLIDYYSRAKVFVLPSRTDGWGMVLSQAVACGLPIVCSKNTGGSDLQGLLDERKWIIELEELTVEALGRCINEALELANAQVGLRTYSEGVLHKLTWSEYGKRYHESLCRIVGDKNGN